MYNNFFTNPSLPLRNITPSRLVRWLFDDHHHLTLAPAITSIHYFAYTIFRFSSFFHLHLILERYPLAFLFSSHINFHGALEHGTRRQQEFYKKEPTKIYADADLAWAALLISARVASIRDFDRGCFGEEMLNYGEGVELAGRAEGGRGV